MSPSRAEVILMEEPVEQPAEFTPPPIWKGIRDMTDDQLQRYLVLLGATPKMKSGPLNGD